MQFTYPLEGDKADFVDLELKGMQALAIGAGKAAKKYYDRAILADPSLKTIGRVIDQYDAAGLGGTADYNAYYRLACDRQRLEEGQEDFGNFNHVLNMMRKQNKKFIDERRQQLAKVSKDRPSSPSLPPSYEESMSESSSLIKNGKPNT